MSSGVGRRALNCFELIAAMTISGLASALTPVLTGQGIAPDKALAMTGEVIGPPAIRPFVVAHLAGTVESSRTVLVIVATTRESQDLAQSIRGLLTPESVVGHGRAAVSCASTFASW